MKRREIWGSVLIVAATLCAWAGHVISEAYWPAAREGMLLYLGIPADFIASRFLIVALLSGVVGLLFLLPALTGHIPRQAPRRIVGWTTGVAAAAAVPYFGLRFIFAALGAFGAGDTLKVTAVDGQSVLVTQDGFDGETVDIYTRQDEHHYERVRDAPEISGWPRVRDQDRRLDSADGVLLFLCGDNTLGVVPQEAGT